MHNIWFAEGLSSQRDIIHGVKQFARKNNSDIVVFASHHAARHEILAAADYAFIEPQQSEKKLAFILKTIQDYNIHTLHAGRHGLWFEQHRTAIEAAGATLTTGATRAEALTLAEDKFAFAQCMAQQHLPVVPSWRVENAAELKAFLASPPFSGADVCIKPVTGIYGLGFWRFDKTVSPMTLFTHPEYRVIQPEQYLAAISHAEAFTPLVLMPYLPGPEYSVDILADKGEILAAVSRRKEGALQYLENAGDAFELACACARAMNADGLINVQTRNDGQGNPVLLETNLRPSGGIGYTLHSGVNLAGLFAAYKLGLLSKSAVIAHSKASFSPVVIRTLTEAILYPDHLNNGLN